MLVDATVWKFPKRELRPSGEGVPHVKELGSAELISELLTINIAIIS